MPKYKHYFVVDIILAAIFIFIAVRAVNGSLNEYAYYSTETEEAETETETRRRPVFPVASATETEDESEETETEEGETYIVTINLNFRTEPNINSEVIEVLATGTRVKVIDTTESDWWWKIEYDGRTGYVDRSYLTTP